MDHNAQVLELYDRMLDSGSTPEEVCADYPELLPALQEQLAQCQRLEAELDDLLPPLELTAVDDLAAPDGRDNLPNILGYEVESVLGRGGMGIVYKARHLRLGRTIALKMLLSGAYASRVERVRFLREARSVAALRHPNIVQVHDVDEFEGRPFFTMEFVEGMTLARSLAGTPQLVGQAAEMLVTLAEAIESAHQSGIVHRDLKPANILLTNDGTPKISDFGLARRVEGEETLTLTGARVGTLCYMAPEQVFNQTGTVGPAADIYALRYLYEMLTGRPPFRAESTAETERQLISDDPPPPSRLNARVPKDLETICMKCLQKDPRRRYVTALALAEDLRRFQRGEPILARQTSRAERAVKWVRRRPTVATMLASAAVVLIAMVSGMLWVVTARAANARAADQELRKAAQFQRQSNWTDAREAMDRAELRLGDHGPRELYDRLNQEKRDSQLAAKLDDIQMTQIQVVADPNTNQQAYHEYAKVFRDAGLITEEEDPQVVAARVRNSNICPAIMAGMEKWVFCAYTEKQKTWLRDLVNRIDKGQDPTGWRDRVREAWSMNDGGQSLMKLALSARFADQNPSFLLAVERHLRQSHLDTVPYMTRVMETYPSDFWTNVTMGYLMVNNKHDNSQAIRYYQTALALRPEVASIHYVLGIILWDNSRRDEAIAQIEQSLRLDPGYTDAHIALGDLSAQLGHYGQAVTECEEAVRENPKDVDSYIILAATFRIVGRNAEALECYRKAVLLKPKQTTVRQTLVTALIQMGQSPAEIIAAWKAEIDTNPTDIGASDGYAEYCLFAGQEDAYHSARTDLLNHFGSDTDPRECERIGRACLLLPPTPAELKQATALIDRALNDSQSSESNYYEYFAFAKALAEYRAGHIEATISMLKQVGEILGPAPRLLLAMAQCRQGQLDQAKKTLMQAIVMFDWSPGQANYREPWLYHILRRQAEGMILTNMPAFLRGEYQPKGNIERLSFTAVCQFQNLNATGARLWVDAFSEDPSLEKSYGYNAARFAALAGCGHGDDVAKLSDASRAQLRKQARDWLLTELVFFESRLINEPTARESIQATILSWVVSSDLAGLRDPDSLAKLPKAEQADYLALWTRCNAILNQASPATAP